MRHLVFVTGRQGTGKTTFCRSHEYHCLPGQELRKLLGEKFFLDKPNPNAPTETESMVRDIVGIACSSLPDNRTMYVDGMPRNHGQIAWILEAFKNQYYSLQFLILTTDTKERTRRLFERDADRPDSRSLSAQREDQECVFLYEMMTELHSYGVPYAVINTTHEQKPLQFNCPPIDPGQPHPLDINKTRSLILTDLRTIWQNHVDAFFQKFSVWDTSRPYHAGSSATDCIIKYLQHVKKEIDEALEVLPDKCYPIKELTYDVAKVRIELIDAFHFMISAAMYLGMSGEDFAMLYEGKRQVNMKRQKEGYLKTRAGVDDTNLGR